MTLLVLMIFVMHKCLKKPRAWHQFWKTWRWYRVCWHAWLHKTADGADTISYKSVGGIIYESSPLDNCMSPVKRICVFEHSVMTNFNCACPAIQRHQGSGFLSEGSSWLTACLSEQRRFWWDCVDAQARLSFAARIGDKYQIRLTRSTWRYSAMGRWKVCRLSCALTYTCICFETGLLCRVSFERMRPYTATLGLKGEPFNHSTDHSSDTINYVNLSAIYFSFFLFCPSVCFKQFGRTPWSRPSYKK